MPQINFIFNIGDEVTHKCFSEFKGVVIAMMFKQERSYSVSYMLKGEIKAEWMSEAELSLKKTDAVKLGFKKGENQDG